MEMKTENAGSNLANRTNSLLLGTHVTPSWQVISDMFMPLGDLADMAPSLP